LTQGPVQRLIGSVEEVLNPNPGAQGLQDDLLIVDNDMRRRLLLFAVQELPKPSCQRVSKGIDRLDTGEYGSVAGPGAGLPIMRWGTGVLPVAHLDGSAMVENIGVLSTDMRRWAPDETGTVIPEVELPPGDDSDD
jgi:hypothetical protein